MPVYDLLSEVSGVARENAPKRIRELTFENSFWVSCGIRLLMQLLPKKYNFESLKLYLSNVNCHGFFLHFSIFKSFYAASAIF